MLSTAAAMAENSGGPTHVDRLAEVAVGHHADAGHEAGRSVG